MTYNRECANCGSQYYVCRRCVDINSWKNVCCSRDCYRQFLIDGKTNSPKIINKEVGLMPTILRAGLTNGRTIDIIGYDLELGRFDCSDGVTRAFDSFEYFIIPKEEMRIISKRMEDLINNSHKQKSSSNPRAKKSEI